jgi:hypothetical protein
MLARFRRQGKLLVYLVLFVLSPNEDHLLLYVLHDSLDLCKSSKSKAAKCGNYIIDSANITAWGETVE